MRECVLLWAVQEAAKKAAQAHRRALEEQMAIEAEETSYLDDMQKEVGRGVLTYRRRPPPLLFPCAACVCAAGHCGVLLLRFCILSGCSSRLQCGRSGKISGTPRRRHGGG